jgi:crotonobetainyl-CoA:carnitine CoA-transferase CaiB-like acyl-CoA transferase
MRDSGATVGPIYSIADAAVDAHFTEREVIVSLDDEDHGVLPMHNIVPRMSATPGGFRRPAPALGEHTTQVLEEAGVSPQAVARIVAGAAR